MWYIMNMKLFTAVIKLSAVSPHTADLSIQYTQTHEYCLCVCIMECEECLHHQITDRPTEREKLESALPSMCLRQPRPVEHGTAQNTPHTPTIVQISRWQWLGGSCRLSTNRKVGCSIPSSTWAVLRCPWARHLTTACMADTAFGEVSEWVNASQNVNRFGDQWVCKSTNAVQLP